VPAFADSKNRRADSLAASGFRRLKAMATPCLLSPGECDQSTAQLPLRGLPKKAELVNLHLPSEGWTFLQQSTEKRVSLERASCTMAKINSNRFKLNHRVWRSQRVSNLRPAAQKAAAAVAYRHMAGRPNFSNDKWRERPIRAIRWETVRIRDPVTMDMRSRPPTLGRSLSLGLR
jgi:hypothetical protein